MSNQTVYFTNPAVISGIQTNVTTLQGQVAALSTYNSITTFTGTLQSNTYNIWQLPAINGYTGIQASLTFPANPNNGDFIYIKDGFGTWGNQLYNAANPGAAGGTLGSGPILNFNGKTAKDACADGLLLPYRQGSVSFTFNSGTNQWEGNSELDLSKNSNFPGNNPDDPWTGWWTNISRGTAQTLFSTLTATINGQSMPYVYIDNTVYPASVTIYYGTTRNPDTFGSTTFRTYEPTGSYLISTTCPLGSRTTYPIGTANLNQAFILQSDKNYITYSADISTGTYGSISTFLSQYLNLQVAIFRKLSTSPFNQAPNISSMNSYDDTEILSSPFKQNPVEMVKNMVYQHFAEDAPDTLARDIVVPNFPYTYSGTSTPYRNKPEVTYNTGGWYAIEQELNEWINVGKTFTIPIIGIIKSQSGSASSPLSFDIQPGSTQITDILTGECNFAYPGSNVTISGCTGTWAGLNGYYPNGASIWGWSTIRKDIDSGFMDYKKIGSAQFTGTYVNQINKIALTFDSYSEYTGAGSSYSAFRIEDDPLRAGQAIDFNLGSTATVTVTHKFTPTMTFNEFVAAFYAFITYTYGSCVHLFYTPNYIPTATYRQGKLPTDWNKLGNISTNSVVGNTPLGVLRPSNSSVATYLHVRQQMANSSTVTFGPDTLKYTWVYRNDPYHAEAYQRSKFGTGAWYYSSYTGTLSYNTTLSTGPSMFVPNVLNYVTGARFQVFGWAGTGRNGPIETDLLYNKTNLIYNLYNTEYPSTLGGSQIISKLFPVETVATGSGGPNVLDANFYMMGNAAVPSSAADRLKIINRDKLANIAGFINPAITSGKVVAYYKVTRSANHTDTLSLMQQPIYGPKTGPASLLPRYYTASYSLYWSKFMEYLVRDGGATSFIIDNRSNNGGVRPFYEFAPFFGDNRAGWKPYMARKGDGFADLIDPTSWNFGPGMTAMLKDSLTIPVSDMRTAFPGCVFSGTGVGEANAKKLVLMSTDGSISNGCISQLFWLGDKWDKNIGSNTWVKFVGSSDPKWSDTSAAAGCYDPPLSKNSKKITYSGNNTTYPYMTVTAPSCVGKIAVCPTGPNSTGALWCHSIIPQQSIDTLTYTGPWIGTAGGNPLPCDYASTIWQEWGFVNATGAWNYIGYDGFEYLNDGRPQPNPNDWTTWRDRWLETSIREAISGKI